MQRQLRYLFLLSILLNACVSASASSPTQTPVPQIPTATLTPSPLPPAPETPSATATIPPPPQPISRVVIVTFDGLRPDAIEAADMDNVRELMQAGAYTLTAQTIMPSTTLPAHASLVTGTCPAKHVVRWNEYVPQNGYALGTDIFDLTRAVGLRTVLIAGKEKIQQITSSADFFGWVDNTDEEKDKTTLDNMVIEQIRLGFGPTAVATNIRFIIAEKDFFWRWRCEQPDFAELWMPSCDFIRSDRAKSRLDRT